MKFCEFLQKNVVRLDGGMGTLLQEQGLEAGELPERWNLSRPEVITEIHKGYFAAGSHVVATNTFGANLLKFDESQLEAVVAAAVHCAQKARDESDAPQEKFIALDIGPSGKLLKPYGDLDFEKAVSLFAATVRLGVKYGVDLILIETMNDCYETKAAVLAAKENSTLPVLVSNAYGEDKKLMTGASPAAMVAMLEGLGVTALGANCSLGPKALKGVVEELLDTASVPVLLKPNAGLPTIQEGKTVFDVSAEEFAEDVKELVQKGVRLIGGCCGTTPEYIRALTERTQGLSPLPIEKKNQTLVSSYTHAVSFGKTPVVIGERINPTGKKRFKQALREGDIDYILGEGFTQQEKGAHVLDVNVGLPEIDEKKMLTDAVCALQAVIDLPLQIDTSDAAAMEAALRRYNGKPLINSVNGKKESMDSVFPLVKKYGGVVVALTLDEGGIPENAAGRVEIAKKILAEAAKYGIEKKDIIFDTLAMTVSADNKAAVETLNALQTIKQELGCHTSLGVSNVSFGLPCREVINATFFALALEKGLSGAIVNPSSLEMMKTYYAYCALHGLDENCANYIEKAVEFTPAVAVEPSPVAIEKKTEEGFSSELSRAIVKGLKDLAASCTRELLKSNDPLSLVNQEIIPALNTVGEGFEQKRVYLPQLLMSAESAKAAFEVIKESLPAADSVKKAVVVLATVKGDIHDIGKNIVKLLLENYGFSVVDLGRDVPPERIVEETVSRRAPLVGLSALMTTTVPAMEETIRQLRAHAPWCKVIVGGAVLTQEYADKMGADKYAKDGMETVRYCETLF